MAKGNIRWYSTIRMKVVAVVIISCTLVLGGLSAYNTINEQKQLSSDLQKLARVTSQRLSKHLIGPMWDLDKDLVDSTLEAEMLEDNIQAIVVWDEGGAEVFSARERGPGGRLIESNGAVAGDLLQSKNDVNNGTKSIGQVAVFVSKRQLNQQLTESTIANVITLGGIDYRYGDRHDHRHESDHYRSDYPPGQARGRYLARRPETEYRARVTR